MRHKHIKTEVKEKCVKCAILFILSCLNIPSKSILESTELPHFIAHHPVLIDIGEVSRGKYEMLAADLDICSWHTV